MNIMAEKSRGIIHSPTRDLVTRAFRTAAFDSASATAVREGSRSLGLSPIQYIHRWFGEHTEIPYMFVRHEQMDLTGKATMFDKSKTDIARVFDTEEPVKAVKTVSLEIEGEVVAVTSLGNTIDRRKIADDLGITYKKLKGAVVNPATINAVKTFGSESGVVGPFVLPEHADMIATWYYLHDASIPEHTPVHIALSQTQSVVIQKGDFEQLLEYFGQILGSGETSFFRQLPTE